MLHIKNHLNVSKKSLNFPYLKLTYSKDNNSIYKNKIGERDTVIPRVIPNKDHMYIYIPWNHFYSCQFSLNANFQGLFNQFDPKITCKCSLK